MRKCECYQDKKKNEANSRGLNAFHGGRDGMAPSPDKTPTSPDKENVGEDDLKRPVFERRASRLQRSERVNCHNLVSLPLQSRDATLCRDYRPDDAADIMCDQCLHNPPQDSNLGMGHFVRPNSVMGGGSSRGGSSLWFNYEGKTAEDLLIDLKKWREEVSPLPLTAGT